MSEIRFIDTTLRDGQQSLWALGMRTADMLGAAAQMDRIGFESMEFFVSIMIKKYVREHKENPGSARGVEYLGCCLAFQWGERFIHH